MKFKFTRITDIDREVFFMDSISKAAAAAIPAPAASAGNKRYGFKSRDGVMPPDTALIKNTRDSGKNHIDGNRADIEEEKLWLDILLYRFPASPEVMMDAVR